MLRTWGEYCDAGRSPPFPWLTPSSMSLMATATSLEQQTTGQLTIFATSAFSAHALVSTVLVIQAVVLSVAKPPMSKFADVFGRFEAFTAAVFI